MRDRSSGLALASLVLCLLFLTPSAADAQMMHLDDLPWFAPADSTSRLALVVEVSRFEDRKWGWDTNRLQLTAVMPAGSGATFFLRGSHLTFNAGETSLLTRWPWLRGEEAVDNWPGGSRQSSFGQPEIGATGPLQLSFLPAARFAVALGLPVGTDRVYPFGSTSFPLRVALRKTWFASGPTQLMLTVHKLMHMASGKNLLLDDAFPGGYGVGILLKRYGGPGRRLEVSWDYENRQGAVSQKPGVAGWLPWTDRGSVGLKVACELAGTLDRPAQWSFALMWRFDSPKYGPGAAAQVE